MSLRGKVALLTYGYKHPGVDKARELARQGADLALHYHCVKSRDLSILLRDDLQKRHPGIKISIHGGELGIAAAVQQLLCEVVQAHQRVDIVVNAAGNMLQKPESKASTTEYFAYAVFVDEQQRQWVGRYNESIQTLSSAS